jgi:circadian clock protein KaiB
VAAETAEHAKHPKGDALKKQRQDETVREFEQALADQETERYELRLYVTGTTPKSLRAIANIKQICEEHLKGRYHLQVIDVYQQPSLAKGEQIIAAPTLIKKLPKPLRRIIGDLSNKERLLLGLDLREHKAADAKPKPRKRPSDNGE